VSEVICLGILVARHAILAVVETAQRNDQDRQLLGPELLRISHGSGESCTHLERAPVVRQSPPGRSGF
jgi:hypothetical protein